MSEREWLNERAYAQWMVRQLSQWNLQRTKAGRRKLRLFACACCRVAWQILPDDRLRSAVETSEKFADGAANDKQLAAALEPIRPLAADSGPFGKKPRPVRVAIDMAIAAADTRPYEAASRMTATTAPLAGQLPERKAEAALCNLLRCIFGNPFQPIAPEPAWRSKAAISVARGIYESRNFDDLPILGDAFEEAGCDHAALLEHCRSGGPHARGCWAVDLALGNK